MSAFLFIIVIGQGLCIDILEECYGILNSLREESESNANSPQLTPLE